MTVRIALAITFLVVAVGFSGCADGSNGSMTLDEYFQKLVALDAAADERFGDVEGRLDDAAQGNDEGRAAAIRTFLRESGSILSDFLDSLATLDPPSEIEDAHGEFVETGRQFGEYWAGVVERSESMSPTEIASELGQVGNEETAERWTAACLSLQQRADQQGVGLDLDCEENA